MNVDKDILANYRYKLVATAGAQLTFNLLTLDWNEGGDTDIEEIEQALNIRLPEEREYDTLGGLVFSRVCSFFGLLSGPAERFCSLYMGKWWGKPPMLSSLTLLRKDFGLMYFFASSSYAFL